MQVLSYLNLSGFYDSNIGNFMSLFSEVFKSLNLCSLQTEINKIDPLITVNFIRPIWWNSMGSLSLTIRNNFVSILKDSEKKRHDSWNAASCSNFFRPKILSILQRKHIQQNLLQIVMFGYTSVWCIRPVPLDEKRCDFIINSAFWIVIMLFVPISIF